MITLCSSVLTNIATNSDVLAVGLRFKVARQNAARPDKAPLTNYDALMYAGVHADANLIFNDAMTTDS
jgi:hypothetical protein